MQVIGLIFIVFFSSSLVASEKRQSGASLEQMVHQLQKKVSELEANSKFPLGFIYVQLPKESAPSELWPSMKWTEVSATYAGVFFRVAGGGAGNFGTIQRENAPRLVQVQHYLCEMFPTNRCDISAADRPSIPSDGTWSTYVLTATSYLNRYTAIEDSKRNLNNDYLRFRHSTGEVRPRNMAVKVWKRTG